VEGTISPDKTEIAGSRLYARAKQQQRSIEEKQRAKPYKCTFTPNFETSKKSRGSTDRKVGEFTTGMTESASGQERFDCLYRDAQAKLDRKKGKSARELKNPTGCTFSPAFESSSKHRSRDQTTGIQRMKNLYSDGKKIKTKLEMRKAETAQTEAPNFSPQITRKAKNMDKYRSKKNFSERLYRDERSKFDHLANKKKELEVAGCTFRPKITRARSAPKSRPSWAVDEDGNQGVAERLYKYNSKIAAKRAVLLEEQEQKIEKETPFKPKLATTHYHEAREQRVSGRKKFDVERLMNQGGVQEKAARREALLRAEAKLLTFTPKIPKRRATSAPKSRPTWMNENEDTSNGNVGRKRTAEVYDRLYADRFYAEEERMVAKEEQFIRDMRDCTFSPSIPLKKHEKSKVSSSTPVWERLYDDKMSIALLREEIKAQKELTGCTFQPSTSSSSSRSAKINKMASAHSSTVGEAVHERLSRVHDAKYDLLEMEKERLELSSCTFQPTIRSYNDSVLKKSGIVKLRSSGGNIYERLHEEAKMSKIVLENKKRQFEQEQMAECTFMPKVGVDIDDGIGSVTSGGSTRIDRLAEPRSVYDKRFNLEHSKLQESKRRPSGVGASTRETSGSGTFREKKQQEKNDNVIEDIVKGMVVGGDMGGGEWENDMNDNPFTFEELNEGTPKTVQSKVEGEAKTVPEKVEQVVAEAPPTPINPNPMLIETPQKTTPITDISADSNMTPPEEKKTKKELQDEFEVWQREMEKKLEDGK